MRRTGSQVAVNHFSTALRESESPHSLLGRTGPSRFSTRALCSWVRAANPCRNTKSRERLLSAFALTVVAEGFRDFLQLPVNNPLREHSLLRSGR